MSLAHNGSSAIRGFKHSDAIEICNRIIFEFYPGLFVHHAASIIFPMQMAVPTPYSTTQLSSTTEAGKKVNQTTCSIAIFNQLPDCVCVNQTTCSIAIFNQLPVRVCVNQTTCSIAVFNQLPVRVCVTCRWDGPKANLWSYIHSLSQIYTPAVATAESGGL